VTWLTRPPRILCAVATVWVLIVVVTCSDAGVPFPTWMLLAFFSLGLATYWLIRLSITWVYGRRESPSWIRKNCRSWLLATCLVAAGFAVAATSPLLSIRVYLSAPALRESPAVLTKVPQEELYKDGRWVGLFRVREFSQFGSEMRFITNECGVVDTCGVVFSPDGPPENRGEDSFSHLFGPWWHWYQSF
jgi:hypothetical protein